MKRFFTTALIVTAVAAVTLAYGTVECSAADMAGDCVKMAEIRLVTDTEPADEYCFGEITVTKQSAPEVEDDSAGYNSGESAMNSRVQIKLRGNSSKEAEKKAYTVKFEDDEELLGMDAGRKWALVSNPFDKSLLRPAVGLYYAAALGIEYTPDFRLCHVWLNDVYMGVYTVMEPVEAGEGRVEIDAEGGDFLLERNRARYEEDKVYIDSPAGLRFEFNEPEHPDEPQQKQCYELLMQAESAIMSGDHSLYTKYIDVDSFVNFYIFHELIKDIDFGEYSTRYYFKDSIMYAGPPWDLDLTMGNVSADKPEYKYSDYNNLNVNELENTIWTSTAALLCSVTDTGLGQAEMMQSTRGLWAAGKDYYYWLCKDPWFMEKVKMRWMAAAEITENLTSENERSQSVIDKYLSCYYKDLCRNYEDGGLQETALNGVSGSGCCADWIVSEPAHVSEWQQPSDSYDGNAEMLRLWLRMRTAYLDSQWDTVF